MINILFSNMVIAIYAAWFTPFPYKLMGVVK